MVPSNLSSSEEQKSLYTRIYYERNYINLSEDLHLYMFLLYDLYQRMEILIFFPGMSTQSRETCGAVMFVPKLFLTNRFLYYHITLNQSVLELQDLSGFVLSFLLLVINKILNISLFHFAFKSVLYRLAQDPKLKLSTCKKSWK